MILHNTVVILDNTVVILKNNTKYCSNTKIITKNTVYLIESPILLKQLYDIIKHVVNKHAKSIIEFILNDFIITVITNIIDKVSFLFFILYKYFIHFLNVKYLYKMKYNKCIN